MKGVSEVRRRIDDVLPASAHQVQSALDLLIDALGRTTREYLLMTYGTLPESSPAELDHIVSESPIIRSILEDLPGLSGPLQRASQMWVEAAPTSFAPRRQTVALSATSFKAVASGVFGKPTHGLYTSTLLAPPALSMWRRHIERLQGSLFPAPYRTYHISVLETARIAEITSAEAWSDLVSQFPVERDGLNYPDWLAIAAVYDGVHLTLPAILASQGIVLLSGERKIAPMFWDVETTLWLRWCFSNPVIISEA